jgi:hypothetical protein
MTKEHKAYDERQPVLLKITIINIKTKLMSNTENIRLSNLNSTFVLEGNEKRRSIEIQSIAVEDGNPEQLQLVILDEKDVTIHTQPLKPDSSVETGEIPINQRFAFYDHLSVCVKADSPETAFDVVVTFR